VVEKMQFSQDHSFEVGNSVTFFSRRGLIILTHCPQVLALDISPTFMLIITNSDRSFVL
jgi:hypothetical protein